MVEIIKKKKKKKRDIPHYRKKKETSKLSQSNQSASVGLGRTQMTFPICLSLSSNLTKGKAERKKVKAVQC